RWPHHPVPCAFDADPGELLDVDVDQLARSLFLVTVRWFWWFEPAELAETDPAKNQRDRRDRHVQHLGDLGTRGPDPSEGGDRLNSILRGFMWGPFRSRTSIRKTDLALSEISRSPLRRGLGRNPG